MVGGSELDRRWQEVRGRGRQEGQAHHQEPQDNLYQVQGPARSSGEFKRFSVPRNYQIFETPLHDEGAFALKAL